MGDPAPPLTDYCIVVVRSAESRQLGIWPISIREKLPLIPVPLDSEFPDAILDLRAAIDRIYDEGRYSEQLDYTKPPKPRLREPDAGWARELLAEKSRAAIA